MTQLVIKNNSLKPPVKVSHTRSKILIIIVFVFLSFQSFAQGDRVVSGDISNMTFKEFASAAEASLKIKIYFRDEWVEGLKVVDYKGSNSLNQVLDFLLKGTALFYNVNKHGDVVLTKDYNVRIQGAKAAKETGLAPPSDYAVTGDNGKSEGNAPVEIGNPSEKFMPGDVLLTGYIKDRDTKEPVAGVTVFNQKLMKGAVSNDHGYYSMSVPRGFHVLRFSFIGMKEKSVSINLYGQGELNVELNSVLIPLKETVVSAQRSKTLQRFEVGVEKITMSSFRLMPTSMGETDIIKSVLLIPGVSSVGEGASGFNVRGGAADQNLILLYGAPLYNSSHFFGFFSAVNSDIIRDATLYKGGIPPRYGGRISSVLDIGSREGNRNEFAGNAGISPVTTHLTLEGPIIKDTLTYLLAARTTYSNWIFKLFSNPALKNSKANFYDLNGKIVWDLNKKNKIDLSVYTSHDNFRLNSDTTYSYNNNLAAFKWRHYFNNSFFSSTSVNNSRYDYEVSSSKNKLEAFNLQHVMNSTAFKSDFNLFHGRHEINFGLEIIRYSVLPGKYLPVSDSSLIAPRSIERERAFEGAIYADDKIVISDLLSVEFGVRLSSFLSLGPQQVLAYNPAYSKSLSTVIDTMNFTRGEVTGKYGGPEFRISLNFKLSDRNSFKVNYSRTRQYIHLLSNTASISPTDTWKLSDYYLKPQIGDQIGAGFYEMLMQNRVEASAEIYYKRIRNLVDFKGGTDLVMEDNIEKDIVNLNGRAYGVELALKKTEGKIQYSFSYTYSRTLVKSPVTFSEEIINSGKWFPANFDKPHDLIATFNYIYSRRVSLSADYTWSTGRPVTYPVATYPLYDGLLVHYSDRNRYRIPDYSRFDIAVKVSGNLKSRRIAHPNWTFSIYNLLGRQNVYSVYFTKEQNVFKGYRLSIFGRAIPSITFSFDF